MRVAYYSPLPPERSGIADYSALLLPALRRRMDVEVARRAPSGPARTDVALYHVGNNPQAHGWIVDAFRRRPGVVVLHDLVLHHLVAGLTLARGNPSGYIAAMERDGGEEARRLAEDVSAGGVRPPWETEPERYPLAGAILDHATGLVVHSRYTERGAREEGYRGRIWRIPLAAAPVPGVEPARIEGSPVIGSFGHVNPAKRIPQLLRAFAKLRESFPRAKLVLAGAIAPGFELDRRIEGLGLEDAVVSEGYVDDRRLVGADGRVRRDRLAAGADDGGDLCGRAAGARARQAARRQRSRLVRRAARARSSGTSRSVGRRSTCWPPSWRSWRATRAHAARWAPPRVEYVRTDHDLERVAELYLGALEWAVGGEAVSVAVVREIAQAAADVEIGADSPELAVIARELRESEIV